MTMGRAAQMAKPARTVTMKITKANLMRKKKEKKNRKGDEDDKDSIMAQIGHGRRKQI